MRKPLLLFRTLGLAVWGLALVLGGAAIVVNLQVRRDLAEIRHNVDVLTTQRDEALAVAEGWRMLWTRAVRRCGPQEQEL